VADPSDVILLVGAGISAAPPTSLPCWEVVARAAIEQAATGYLTDATVAYATEELEEGRYYNVFRTIKEKLAHSVYCRLVGSLFCTQKRLPNETHKLVAASGVKGVLTTNFDPLIETAFASSAGSVPRSAMYSETSRLRHILSHMEDFFVVKLHGDCQVVESLVLTPEHCSTVAANTEIGNLFREIVTHRQLVILGYSARDPDFWALWSNVLRELVPRNPAVACFPTSEERVISDQFADHDIHVALFDNTDGRYTYVAEFLRQLQAVQKRTAADLRRGHPSEYCAPLEEYVHLYCELSEDHESRLVAFISALCIAELVDPEGSTDRIEREQLRRRVRRQLGLSGARIEKDFSSAVQLLTHRGIVLEGEGGGLTVEEGWKSKLREFHANLRAAENDILASVLQQVSKSDAISGDDVQNFRDVFDEVLKWLGSELAEQVLFLRLPVADEKGRVRGLVVDFCEARSLDCEVFWSAIERLVFAMTEEEEEWLEQKLRAHFLTSAYVMHPTSERLLREYASQHVIYLDSSIALPLIAEGHPLNKPYRALLRHSLQLGVEIRLSEEMLSEVAGHLAKAIRQFTDIDGQFLREKLQAYIQITGELQGNVFLEGYLKQLGAGERGTWKGYLDSLCVNRSGALIANKTRIAEYMEAHLSVRVDNRRLDPAMDDEIERLTHAILGLRTRRQTLPMGLAWTLSKHEAQQFVRVQSIRAQDPEAELLTWFLTTDSRLASLQLSERERYPFPIAYSPHGWGQYLNLLDYQSRSSKHFSRLLRRAQFGIMTGDAALSLVRQLSIKLHEKRAEAAEERIDDLVGGLFRDAHLRHALVEESQRERDGLPPDENSRRILEQALDSFVVKAQDDWEALQTEMNEVREENTALAAENEALRRRTKAKDHHIGILRGKLKG